MNVWHSMSMLTTCTEINSAAWCYSLSQEVSWYAKYIALVWSLVIPYFDHGDIIYCVVSNINLIRLQLFAPLIKEVQVIFAWPLFISIVHVNMRMKIWKMFKLEELVQNSVCKAILGTNHDAINFYMHGELNITPLHLRCEESLLLEWHKLIYATEYCCMQDLFARVLPVTGRYIRFAASKYMTMSRTKTNRISVSVGLIVGTNFQMC